jgi:hypothetical protein
MGMRAVVAIVFLLGLTGQNLWAEAPNTSTRPLARPQSAVAAPVNLPEQSTPTLRPRQRPISLAPLPPDPLPQMKAATPRPRQRPAGLADDMQLAAAPMPDPEAQVPKPKKGKKEKLTKKGSVCGDLAIKGEVLSPISAKVKGCGLDQPVRVTSVEGIRLNQPATISCETADAFKQWINQAMRPAFGNREVVEIRIAASYICRTRNNKKGAKVSEHGRGKALDVAGFVFADGKEWSIARDYNKQIRKAHQGACGIFGTTLGPGSDGYHEDHLHFDIARHSNGPYCR